MQLIANSINQFKMKTIMSLDEIECGSAYCYDAHYTHKVLRQLYTDDVTISYSEPFETDIIEITIIKIEKQPQDYFYKYKIECIDNATSKSFITNIRCIGTYVCILSEYHQRILYHLPCLPILK